MLQKWWSTWLTIMALTGSATHLCAGQASPAAQFQHKANWNYDFIELPRLEGALVVDLGDVSGVSEWILGVKARSEQPRLVAGEGRYLSLPPGKTLPGRVFERIDNLPPANVETSAGHVALRGRVGSAGPLILCVWAPASTNVTVKSSAGVLTTLPVGDGFVLHNGKVVAVPLEGPGTLIAYLMRAGMQVQAQGDVVALPGNRYVATLAGLKSHLIRYALPSEALRVPSGTATVPVTLSIEINEAGAVEAVSARPGGEAILAHYGSFVKTWRFRPFTVDAKPVRVRAPLTFVVAPSGTVAGPVGLPGSGQQGPGQPGAAGCCETK